MVLYGFMNLKDLMAARVTGTNLEAVNTAIALSVAEHNRQMDALLALFVERTTEYTRRYAQVGAVRLQPLDENGRARPVKPAGYYDVAWPIQMAGAAWGADYVTREKMTVADAERITAMMLEADFRWMRDHILAALFDDDTWTFADPFYGNLTIQPLANGDTVTYQIFGGADTVATDDHQYAQANAIADTDDPFPALYTEITEHPENSGDVISLIPSNVSAAVQGLDAFRPASDPNIREGSGSDVLVGNLGAAVPGTVIGYHTSKQWLVEWPSLPSGYGITLMTGGTRALRMREDPETSLQGYNLVATRNDHPFYESQYLRRAGFGGWNRVGAVAWRIGNGTYAEPSGYDNPIP